MSTYWEELRKKVAETTTSADLAAELFTRVSSTQVDWTACVRPTYYLGCASVLAWDYMDFIEKLLKLEASDNAGAMRLVMYLRETASNMIHTVKELSEPLERVIAMIEERIETEALLEADEEDEEETAPVSDDASAEASDRDALTADKEGLEEQLRVRFNDMGISAKVTGELARKLADVYLECIAVHRALARLKATTEGDSAAIITVLIDLQYGLDIQLRGLLLEDTGLDTEEPSFITGLLPWTSLFLAEVSESMRGEPQPAGA